jgi:phage tail-like protein
MVSFINYLFSKLPKYFKEQDTYKDQNDQGLLERYLSIFGLELDEQVYPLIQDYLNNVDPLQADSKFLSSIAFNLGNPPDFTQDEHEYRLLLSYAITIFKIKGTAQSYNLLFQLFGLTCTIVEIEAPELIRYDDNNLYDNSVIYDTECDGCTYYSLFYGSVNDDCVPPLFDATISESKVQRILDLIYFIEPINAKLLDLVRLYKICEDYETYKVDGSNTVINDINEEISICTYKANIYDSSELYDSSVEYDIDTDFSCTVIAGLENRQFDDSFDFSFA